MDKRKIMELRVKAQSLDATLHIGKDGLTERVVEELARQLKRNRLVKVKMHGYEAHERKRVADELASRTSSVLVETRGGTAVLASDTADG